jgi:hypothetical protein
MIQLVRDDIYSLFESAISFFSRADRDEQQQHIDVFRESARTWRSWQGKLEGQSIYSRLEHSTGFDARMQNLRTQCQRLLRQAFEKYATELCRPLSHTLDRTHSHASQWTGPLLRDDNNRATDRPINFDWLDRQNGYWFL